MNRDRQTNLTPPDWVAIVVLGLVSFTLGFVLGATKL